MSLDVLRALRREEALEALLSDLARRIERIPAALRPAQQSVRVAIDQIQRHFGWLASADRAHIEAGARHLSISLSRTIAAALLIEHAAWSLERENDIRPLISARRWCGEDLVRLFAVSELQLGESRSLALDDASLAAEDR